MGLIEIIISLILTLLGGVIGYYVSWRFSKKSMNDLRRLFNEKFGPQILPILVGEQEGEFTKHLEKAAEAKEAIGYYVAKRWGIEGVTLLLDAGTTTERVARNLSISNVDDLIIFTSTPVAALHFLSRGRQRCFIFPGEIDTNYGGALSNEDFIKQIVEVGENKYVSGNSEENKVRRRVGIVGALPIMPITGPCSIDQRTVHIKQSIIKLSDEIVFVLDFSKFVDEGRFDSPYFPVFDTPDDWKELLCGSSKQVSIITYLKGDNKKDSRRLEKLNQEYYSRIHCISPNYIQKF